MTIFNQLESDISAYHTESYYSYTMLKFVYKIGSLDDSCELDNL